MAVEESLQSFGADEYPEGAEQLKVVLFETPYHMGIGRVTVEPRAADIGIHTIAIPIESKSL